MCNCKQTTVHVVYPRSTQPYKDFNLDELERIYNICLDFHIYNFHLHFLFMLYIPELLRHTYIAFYQVKSWNVMSTPWTGEGKNRNEFVQWHNLRGMKLWHKLSIHPRSQPSRFLFSRWRSQEQQHCQINKKCHQKEIRLHKHSWSCEN